MIHHTTGEFVAGHDFDQSGRCRRTGLYQEDCPITWRSIANTTKDDVGKPNISHYGNLTTDEFGQIKKKHDNEQTALEAAMSLVTGKVCTP